MATDPVPIYDLDTQPEESQFSKFGSAVEKTDCLSPCDSIHDLEMAVAKIALDEVESAINKHDYILAAHRASTVLSQIRHRQLASTLLDRRAYALGIQGKFDDAAKDAEEIIQHQPTSAKGYLRLGWIYSIRGKSTCAVDMYNTGLQHVSQDNPDYNQLINERTVSMERSNKLIDFIAELPVELAHNILANLPKLSKLICLIVSHLWRKKILECPAAWATLTLGYDYEDEHIGTILPLIAGHVRKLTINTKNDAFWSQFARNTTSFSNIKTLFLADSTVQSDINHLRPMEKTLKEVSATLTTLILEFERSGIDSIPVEDLLSACPNLTTLKYATPMLSGASSCGEPLANFPALIDLHLKVSITNSESLESLLPRCPHLRRLVLDGCSSDTLDIIKRSCPRLEILGYNPCLEDVPRLDEVDSDHQPHGLRVIYSTEELNGIPMHHLFRMLEENAETLEMISVDICPSSEQSYSTFYPTFLKLKKLKSLEYWSTVNDDNIEQAFLQSISDCNALTRFTTYGTGAVKAIVDTLIALSPVKELAFQGTIESIIADTSFVALFQQYAVSAHTTSHLESVYFGSCESITDRSLSSLSQVQTLKSITLYQLNNVSSYGLQSFLEALRNSNVLQIELGPWDVVMDHHLYAISEIQKLRELTLDRLLYISDDGLTKLVDNSRRLRLLDLRNCESVTAFAFLYAQKNVDTVLIEEDL